MRSSASVYSGQFREGRYRAILDLSQAILAVSPDNGHAFYYEGETHRVLRNYTEMLGAFRRYIASADHHGDARTGDAVECYKQADGYCQERLAWINHELANYYLNLANAAYGEDRVDPLHTALNYEIGDLTVRAAGFYTDNRMRSSCDLMREVARELAKLRNPSRRAAASISKYCASS